MVKSMNKRLILIGLFVFLFAAWAFWDPSVVMAAKKGKGQSKESEIKANAAFDANKMSDMSGFDPATWVSPKGDTIKIAILASFSGPATINGQMYWTAVSGVAHDINKRGGIFVDGKKKLIEVLKADTMGKVDQTKKVAERMVLQEKADVLWGCDGSHIVKAMNEVANKYKVIALNAASSSDDIQTVEGFGRYAFQGTFSADQVARGLAYYYGQISKKEKKFYILCQDYGFGHVFADGFKNGLKLYHPKAEIVGEDYHKLFLTDFAPYLSKMKASGAEVIFTGDWVPDAANLAKQARAMGVLLPFANIWMTDANMMHDLGKDGGKNWVHVGAFHSPVPFSVTFTKFYKAWNNQWKTWKTAPYNSRTFEHFVAGTGGGWLMQTYWLLSVMERAKTTNADKIIQLWEGDTYLQANGTVIKMRACDHKAIQDLSAEVYDVPENQKASFTIPPYYWYKEASYPGRIYKLPAEKVLPWMDQKLDRCKGKNDWGE